MNTTIIGILAFIFVLGTAVLVHELGHFIAARKFGVLCHEFAIGMGPILWKKRKGETLYTIRAIPIGGYVMMGQDEGERDLIKVGETIGLTLDHGGNVAKIHVAYDEGQVVGQLVSNTDDVSRELRLTLEVMGEEVVYPVARDCVYIDTKQAREQHIVPTDRRLESKPKRQRLVILAAGAIMNFVLAFVFVVIVGAVLGEPVGSSSELSMIMPDSPAEAAGLLAGDQITVINGTPIANGDDLVAAIHSTDEVLIEFRRAGEVMEVTVVPEQVERNGEEHYVIGVNLSVYTERSIAGTFRYASAEFRNGFTLIFTTLGMLASGDAGVQDLSGPVGIAYMTTQFAAEGILMLLVFASLININVGIFNLLPLPALDGGHIFFIGIEAIIGKPVNAKIRNAVQIVGFALFMTLFAFTFFNDIFRFFF